MGYVILKLSTEKTPSGGQSEAEIVIDLLKWRQMNERAIRDQKVADEWAATLAQTETVQNLIDQLEHGPVLKHRPE